jgi:predicted nucleotidyltransferase component of viral defense system
MIEADEIEAQADRLGVHEAHVERDYVFGWLLKAFFENDHLARLLIFKGGNCMRKAYYPETRYSSDLDFSIESALDVLRLQAEINRACRVAQEACGVEFLTERNSLTHEQALDQQRQSYKGRIYFKDFYGDTENITISIRLDATEFDRPHLPPVQRSLIHPYSDAHACRADLKCMALEELIANKLKCLIQRRHSFDLYDLVYATFFDNSVEVNRGLVLRTFLRKTIFESSPGAAKEILLGLPIPLFRGAWQKHVSPIAGRIDFERAECGFRAAIDSIFEGVGISRWDFLPFFPSHLRNLVMDAGSGRKLLALTYDGRDRLVEPYALRYKRRQDGHASEYLYVWDRSEGGSGPGIKTFLQQKILNLTLTDQSFEPRFPIELSKAGEPEPDEHFGKPFSRRSRKRPRKSSTGFLRQPASSPFSSAGSRRGRGGLGFNTKRSTRSPFGPRYRVECPYCQKRFTRERLDTTLRPHKDSNGYSCSGRRGYVV